MSRALGLTWAPLVDDSKQQHLRVILKSWEGTPYAAGSGVRGVASDCVRSTILVLSEWMRWAVPEIKTMPADASMHSRQGAMRGLHRIRRALPPHHRVRDSQTIQPGDVLITGPIGGGPGHSIIVGAEAHTLWQSLPSAGFQKWPCVLPPAQVLFAVLRLNEVSR